MLQLFAGSANPVYCSPDENGRGKEIYFDNAENRIEIEAGTEWLTGYTLYQIGGQAIFPDGSGYDFPDPMSQIKFPLGTWVATVDASFRFSDKFEISIELKKNLTKETGKTEDSDWGVLYEEGSPTASPYSLDIFSTSDTALDFYSAETAFYCRFLHNSGFSISAGCGLIFQYYYFTLSNLDQSYPSSRGISDDIIPGEVAAYTLWDSVFYTAVKFGYSNRFLRIQALAGFSPLVCSIDDDNHILRSKESFADCTGYAPMTGLDFSIYFTDNIYLKFNGSFIYIFTSGLQNQFIYNGSPGNQDQKIVSINYRLESAQLAAGAEIGFSF